MARQAMSADVVTYNALLAVCVGASQHGGAALPDALGSSLRPHTAVV
jgi:hypothetical protein